MIIILWPFDQMSNGHKMIETQMVINIPNITEIYSNNMFYCDFNAMLKSKWV